MPKNNVIHSAKRQARANGAVLDSKTGEMFLDLVKRAYVEKPDKEDLQEIRKFLRTHPQFCKAVFGLAESVQETLVHKMFDQAAPKTAIHEYIIVLRHEFGYEDAPVMEKLLIENLIISWLRLYWTEYQLVMRMGGQVSISGTEFWERRLKMAQKRYLSVCETLARIRKMAVPPLQLNIGDKQVNLVGTLPSAREHE